MCFLGIRDKASFVLTCLAVCFLLASCTKEYSSSETNSKNDSGLAIRSLAEAMEWAVYSQDLLDSDATKSMDHPFDVESIGIRVSDRAKSGATANDTLYYVFNYAGDNGFSIISANESAYPILAVTEKGHYIVGEETGVPAFDYYMTCLEEALSEIPFNGARYEYIHIGDSYAPRVHVNWGQSGVYGQFCPNGISGCVATAIAQILSAHRRPVSFVATCDMSPYYSIGQTVNLNWDLMLGHVSNSHESTGCFSVHNSISALLREIGDLVYMDYSSPNSSGATYTAVPLAFDYFGFTCVSPQNVSVPTMISEIKQCGPVYVRGGDINNNGGHAWVVDGYKDYEIHVIIPEGGAPIGQQQPIPMDGVVESVHSLHFNWGWNGECNGYFAFNVYSPDNSELYDGSYHATGYDFRENVKMIIVH